MSPQAALRKATWEVYGWPYDYQEMHDLIAGKIPDRWRTTDETMKPGPYYHRAVCREKACATVVRALELGGPADYRIVEVIEEGVDSTARCKARHVPNHACLELYAGDETLWADPTIDGRVGPPSDFTDRTAIGSWSWKTGEWYSVEQGRVTS